MKRIELTSNILVNIVTNVIKLTFFFVIDSTKINNTEYLIYNLNLNIVIQKQY